MAVRDAEQEVRFRSDEQATGEELGVGFRGFGYALKIPLSGMKAGTYTLAVEARSKGSGPVIRTVPFEIGVSQPIVR